MRSEKYLKIFICFILLHWCLSTTLYADYRNFTLLMAPVETKKFGQTEKEVEQVNQVRVDYVLVRKKERLLYLYSGNDAVRVYPIALGKQPEGQKQKEGDSRTPEGIYTLDWRNPNSRFFRSIHVSYPNRNQMLAATEAGIDPGGEIMIHGQPSDWSERIKLTFKESDWTEGCIALENQDMIEVWNLVNDGTPIKIEP